MHTIRLQTNQHRLIANLRHAFNQSSMLGELLQNARRAQASEIRLSVTEDSLTIQDNGIGIANLQSLIHIAESGWDESIKSRETAFGMGALATLYFAEQLTVRSRGIMFSTPTARIFSGEPVYVVPSDVEVHGTQICLDGVRSPRQRVSLPDWVGTEMPRLCEAFPVRVWVNDTEVPRPLASPDLAWQQTSMGRVLIDLLGARTQWRCFLQGLPIHVGYPRSRAQIVLLPDDTVARLPDRQHLLNEAEDSVRIQAAVDQAYRQALVDKKAELPASEFAERYADACVISYNADLLNDVPYVPRAWFRSWDQQPAGVHRLWEEYGADGVVSAEALSERGVWTIDADDSDVLVTEVYLQAADAYLLEQPNLHEEHWLRSLAIPICAEQIAVSVGAPLHQQENPGLDDYEIRLELVSTLQIRALGGTTAYDVPALRKGSKLFLTAQACNVTRLISDYIIDDRYDENREDEDAEAIRTFIAIGSSSSPAPVVETLLPHALRYGKQPKLAHASVTLAFDAEGKLASVTSP
ncbi:ATP-binding protein [Acidovorax sp. NCPPB 4044]|uniref:ATP-binding protein n=1 Tax=Acidovorax sp. NCPPB 4044 TaxID=2940490 RepID=UPI00230340BF|nr:ATP-binding protein [Acidovorax sp. NCPPB 4044]MDA8520435.1 ATP-binding protein [Acidovorax sp. NCPPB 4044]